MLVVDGVMHRCAFPPNFHHPAIPEQAELVRHRRFRDAGNDREIANAESSSAQRIKNARTGRVGKSPECFDHNGQQLGRWDCLLCLVNGFWVDWGEMVSYVQPLRVYMSIYRSIPRVPNLPYRSLPRDATHVRTGSETYAPGSQPNESSCRTRGSR
jgi:hypothetical protein